MISCPFSEPGSGTVPDAISLKNSPSQQCKEVILEYREMNCVLLFSYNNYMHIEDKYIIIYVFEETMQLIWLVNICINRMYIESKEGC